jgi:hypothetical protein
LRHGFPQWFQKPQRGSTNSRIPSASTASLSSRDVQWPAAAPSVTAFQLLEYLRSAFSEEQFLDSIPLEAAANTGAYHAWQTYRSGLKETGSDKSKQSSPRNRQSGSATLSVPPQHGSESLASRSRKPGEWNWEGVWEERVRRGVQSSLSEPVLFGAAASGDDIVCPPYQFSENNLVLIPSDSVL